MTMDFTMESRINSTVKDVQKNITRIDDFKQKINGGFIWNIYDVHIAEEVMEMMTKF